MSSIKYKTKQFYIKQVIALLQKNLKNFSQKVVKIIVKNVLLEFSPSPKRNVSQCRNSDYPDISLKKPTKNNYKNVKFGNNVLIGKNVKIGKNSHIGSNTIIQHDVVIGKNCIIGSNVIIKNSLIGDERVNIQDNCNIGQKGFGFIPMKNKNLKFPHIGKVIIENDVELATSCSMTGFQLMIQLLAIILI